MHKRIVYTVCLSLFYLFCGSSVAKTVILPAVADVTVKSTQPDSTFHLEDLNPYKCGTVGSPGEINISYLQFQIPGDVESAIEAHLNLTQTTNNGVLAYYIYGIFDNVYQADADTYTWNNAPAHDPDNLIIDNGHRYDPLTSAYIAYIPVSRLDPVGTTYSDDLMAAGIDLINNDTDSVLTFMVVRRQALTLVSTLASIENPDWPGPELELNYISNGSGVGLEISESQDSTEVNEQGETEDTYTIALTEIPEYDVTVEIVPGVNITVQPESLVFTQRNWNEPAGVKVTALDDTIKQDETVYFSQIGHSISSEDHYYDNLPDVFLDVFITDNDLGCVGGYLEEDFNKDCYVNIQDLTMMASSWLSCTEPDRPDKCVIE